LRKHIPLHEEENISGLFLINEESLISFSFIFELSQHQLFMRSEKRTTGIPFIDRWKALIIRVSDGSFDISKIKGKFTVREFLSERRLQLQSWN
jgi:hypothetical protein